jgi:leader peptidase (prepilin peptidase)/N-methyltransferase
VFRVGFKPLTPIAICSSKTAQLEASTIARLPLLSDFPPSFLIAVAVAFGLVFGSFLNVVIHRLPRGENLAYPGSRCPGCGKPIAARDNVPLVELIGGLLAWAILRTQVLELPAETPIWEAGVVFASYLALGLGLVAAAFIDLDHMFLPDEITLGGAALGFLTVPFRPEASLRDSALGAGVGFLLVWLPFVVLYAKLRGRPGMGLGDAKLVLLAGAWFGWLGAVFALLAGAVQATAVMLTLLGIGAKIEEPAAVVEERRALREAIEKAEGEERAALEREFADDPLAEEAGPGIGAMRLAFGPFIVLAILEYLFYGQLVQDWVIGALVLP